jgi:hypothetical protein
MMDERMAEVLAAHSDWTYMIASNTMACTERHCVWTHALQQGEVGRDVYRNHQAAALSAAGFGPVKEAISNQRSGMKITDEAVEAAAEFLFMDYSVTPYYREQLRAALEAAAPFIIRSHP